MADQKTPTLWARWLPPTFAAALVAVLASGVEIWQTGNIAEEQRAQSERLKQATLSSEERRALARLELEGSIASREQQLTLLGIVAERLLSPDAAARERAVQLLEAVDSEFARQLAGFVERNDTSPRVKAAARRITRLVCTDARWSRMIGGQTLDEAERDAANRKCEMSIPENLTRGRVWKARLDDGREFWCTCVDWGEDKKTNKERRDSRNDK